MFDSFDFSRWPLLLAQAFVVALFAFALGYWLAARRSDRRLALELAQATLVLERDLAASRATLSEQQHSHSRELTTLLSAKAQLSHEFELLSARIFDERSQQLSQRSEQGLNAAINPLREQIKEFRQRVDDVYDRESRDRSSLLSSLDQLKKLNGQLSDDALNLTRALKGDNKVLGNWGEVVLQRLLEDAGLRHGHEFETQLSFANSEGGRSVPDVVLRMPGGRDVIIDAKVSLQDYQSYCEADTEAARQQAMKRHLGSLKAHVSGLSLKAYDKLEQLNSLDFVFIFIPVEGAFLAAFEHGGSLYREAYEKNIILAGPTTLMSSLRTVQNLWRSERQSRNAEQIASQAGRLYDKFAGFVDDVENIGTQLERAADSQRRALSKLAHGRGNLIGSAEKLAELGAKVKKRLPDAEQLLSENTQ